jgi:hypothetical protein
MQMLQERGKIRNLDRIARIRDFSGLRYGRITPTDIDAMIDFGGKLFVFIEAKKAGFGPMSRGQERAYESISDACGRGGSPTLVIVAEHDETGRSEDTVIDFAKMRVVRMRENGFWRDITSLMTVRTAVDDFREKHGLPRIEPDVEVPLTVPLTVPSNCPTLNRIISSNNMRRGKFVRHDGYND